MASLQDQFEQASRDAQNLDERPGNDTLLRLYALFKQATEGDVSGPAPGMFDFKASAKYEAWSKLEGTSQDSAMKKYIDLVKTLKA
jgi:acyl-CoA-binding protein